MTKPAAGEVFRYPFLWKREQMAGETEGRKWVMLDEINTDILERSYVWEDRRLSARSVPSSHPRSSLA